MKSNDKILNEAFFKKTSYDDKLKKQLAQYKPYAGGEKTAIGGKPVGQAFEVSDVGELRKRLTQGIGASFANNSIKNMSNKAIKTFPIIVSDNVEPETVVMLKRYLEEQYAEYINLMISNKTIDLGSFVTDPDGGNIAIQAVNSISGPDFRSDRLANKASATGEVGLDDILANVPIYNLLRQESVEFKCGNELLDTLMEDAIIVDSEYTDKMVKILQEKTTIQDEVFLENGGAAVPPTDPKDSDQTDKNTLSSYLDSLKSERDELKRANAGSSSDRRIYGDEDFRINTRIDTPTMFAFEKLGDAQVDTKQLDRYLAQTIGNLLYEKGNEVIRDRFEKANILLASRRITGSEYISYVTVRLGIPIKAEDAVKIRVSFAPHTLRSGGKVDVVASKSFGGLTKKDLKAIDNNERICTGIVENITKRSLKSVLKSAMVTTAGTAGGAGTVGGLAALITMSLSMGPIGLIPGAIIGGLGGGAVALITQLRKKRQLQASRNKIEGWERVEALIEDLDRHRQSLIDRVNYNKHSDKDRNKVSSTIYATIRDGNNISTKDVSNGLRYSIIDEDEVSPEAELAALDRLSKAIDEAGRKNKDKVVNEDFTPNKEFLDNVNETIVACYEGEQELLREDETFRKIYTAYFADRDTDVLNEKDVLAPKYTKMKKISYDPKDVMVTPAYSARSQYAYGSTEFDRKEIKDRKYNAPLVMTIKFRERLSDGKYTDNELTAMIGIQGVVVRVPSEEMKYILQSNAEGNTLKGFLGSSSITNSIADLLSTVKVKKDVEKLPISADVWHNLEKIAHLTLANKLGGKQSHNISNAHIIFSQKETDEVRIEDGVDYLKDKKLAEQLMKRYSAFSIMIVNDPTERVYVFDDPESISWNVIPYSALRNRDNADNITSALIRATQGRI